MTIIRLGSIYLLGTIFLMIHTNEKPKKRPLPEFLEACKKARRYIHEHPGCTSEEIFAAHPECVGTIMRLQTKRLIRFEDGGKKGPARWFVVPA